MEENVKGAAEHSSQFHSVWDGGVTAAFEAKTPQKWKVWLHWEVKICRCF